MVATVLCVSLFVSLSFQLPQRSYQFLCVFSLVGSDTEKIDGCYDMESVSPGALSVEHKCPDLSAPM